MQNHITLITDIPEKEQIKQTKAKGNCGIQAKEKKKLEARPNNGGCCLPD